ncbi:MAG TPA: SCO family protein [Bacteroides sp.]|nr:SCO family protein [Bacteroides sp.]
MKHIMLALFLSAALITATGQVVTDTEVGVIEKLDQYIPLDVKLADENGDTVILGDIIDKPTIISFVYYRCPGICSPLMDGMADAMDATDLELGEEYQALTISFDHREGTLLASRKKNNYLNLMDKKEQAETGWHFFTGDSASIRRLTEATGFRFKPTGNDFIHSATLIIVDPEGKITRYMNGIYFLPFELKMSLLDAARGKSGPTINRVLQYCYSYDPAGQQYVLNITKVAGTLIIFFGLILFLVLVLFRKRKTTQTT